MATNSDTRQVIAEALRRALEQAQNDGALPKIAPPEMRIERPQNSDHGDYSCNLALRLAKTVRRSPLDVAKQIATRVERKGPIDDVEVAPPGFLNFRLVPSWKRDQLLKVIDAGDRWGQVDLGGDKRVQVEFVSANPTGPLQLGNGRGAVLGDVLASVLDAAGFDVQREYYINDTGEQIRLFGLTLLARYQQHFGRKESLPEGGYAGEYMKDFAAELAELHGKRWLEHDGTPPEDFVRRGLALVIERIREDLFDLNVDFDHWQSESDLYYPAGSSTYDAAMSRLRDGDYTIEKEGAVWFRASGLGDDKDNVLVRKNGKPTYFASDVAYHYRKFIERRFDTVIDVWGADHHGHVARTKAALTAVGGDGDALEVLLYQLVHLRRDGERVRMSKRRGEIVTLRELLDQVGADTVRFFMLQRSADAQMDFDLSLATSHDINNPLWYAQYAHTRCASIIRNAKDKDLKSKRDRLDLLDGEAEDALVNVILKLPELVVDMAIRREPHHLTGYVLELATAFNAFYAGHRIVDEANPVLSGARLVLVEAVRVALRAGLSLLGIQARSSLHFLRNTGDSSPLLTQNASVELRGEEISGGAPQRDKSDM